MTPTPENVDTPTDTENGIPVIHWSDQRQISRLDHFIATGWGNDPEWAVEYRRGDDIGRTMRRVSLPPDAVPGTFVAPTPENVEEPTCNCPRFSDTGGFRIADLTCPIHGVNGTDPGDGMWDDSTPENVETPT